MENVFFRGACTALVTPFLDGKVNYPMLNQLLKRQMDAGIRAIVICGTTGEAPTLSDDEKMELFAKSKEFVKWKMRGEKAAGDGRSTLKNLGSSGDTGKPEVLVQGYLAAQEPTIPKAPGPPWQVMTQPVLIQVTRWNPSAAASSSRAVRTESSIYGVLIK